MASFARVVGSPLGLIRLVAADGALVRLELPRDDGRVLDVDALAPTDEAQILATTARQLDEYFTGKRRDFDVPIAAEGTDFQRAVWDALATIPYGTTTSYVAIARKIGRPSASRAVGAANGANPIAIIVPCHRVIGAAGALTGYGGGLPAKRQLLALESKVTGLFFQGAPPLVGQGAPSLPAPTATPARRRP